MLKRRTRAVRVESGDVTIGSKFAIILGGIIMLQVSAEQLAELLSGIARAQFAIMTGIESAMAGTRSQHIIPALQNAAHLRDHPQPTLTDLPVRVLLSYQSRVGPDVSSIARDLERLCGGVAPEAGGTTAPDVDDGEALDFSKPG